MTLTGDPDEDLLIAASTAEILAAEIGQPREAVPARQLRRMQASAAVLCLDR
jgi:hypothetical protein